MLNIYETKAMKKFVEADRYDTNPNYAKHHIKTRKHILVTGKSGSGKTNFVANFISQFDDTFAEIYIFTAMVDEPIYQMLDAASNDIHVLPLEEIKPYTEMEKLRNKLIVFDDFVGNVNKRINSMIFDYAKLSRKIGCTCMFLTQSFFDTEKRLRSQCSYYVILKNPDIQNLRGILRTINCTVPERQLAAWVQRATEGQFNVVIFDTLDANRPIRRNFDEFLEL